MSEKDIRSWFTKVENYLQEKNFAEILQDGTRIYNGDKTCFLLCPKEDKLLASKGTKNAYEVDQGVAKSNLTVMFTFSASGSMTPPMIIYPYKRIPANIVTSVPNHWGIGTSDNGLMKSELFYEYVSNIFHKHLKDKGIKSPVILFAGGHKSHLTYDSK